ncbi:MAG TPA: fused MFS/spermidine synthase, partial [Actinomycetota bacterium]|nr:fused MFS/spermidine synthase [Actinomycetota bacterium]
RGMSAALLPLVVAVLGVVASFSIPEPCDVETAYHCARVVPDPIRDTGRTLQLDTLPHSYVDLADPTYLQYSYIRAFASVVDAVRAPGEALSALHLGGGGLTFPRYLAETRPGADSLVLEIDGGVIDLDVAELGLRLGRGIQVDVQDARVGLAAQPARRRDVVVGDAFGGLAVPWHLTTRETVADIRRVLRPDGLYMVNVIDYPPLSFARAKVATVAALFRHVAVVARPSVLDGQDGGNLVIVGSNRPLPTDAIGAQLQSRAPELDLIFREGQITSFAGGARVLTDDFAPVDQLVTPFAKRS